MISAQELEDGRACPPFRALGGGQGTGITREQTWLQVTQLAKSLSLNPPGLCTAHVGTRRHRFSKGWFLQDTSGEAPLCLGLSRTTPDNHSTWLYSGNTGNSMALWQVKLPTSFLCSRDKVVAEDIGHAQPNAPHSCYIFASLIFSNLVSVARAF